MTETSITLHPPRSHEGRRAKAVLSVWNLRGAYGAVAVLAIMVLGLIWNYRRGSHGAAFPRTESEFMQISDVDRRLDAVAQTLKADPSDPYALVESGVLHFQKGKDFYPDVINELEEARKLGALDARIFYYLGNAYQQEGLYSFAVAEYQKFLRNQPEDRDVRLLLAKLLYQSGRFEEAVVNYQWLQHHYGNDPLITENLGLSLLSLKRGDEAKAIFQSLTSAGPQQARRAHFYLGQMAVENKDYKQAMDHFSAVMPSEPDLGVSPALVHAAMAANYERLKLPVLAKEHWEKTLQFDPQNAQAKKSIKTLNAALKKTAPRVSKKKKR